MRIKVEELREDSFAAFGAVLGQPDSKEPTLGDDIATCWLGTTDMMGIGSTGARDVTFLKVHGKPEKNDKIECHKTSAEAFIPLVGESILMVVPADAMDEAGVPDTSKMRAFLLDGSKGVLMKKGTWHAVPIPLGDLATFLVLVDDSIIPKNDLNITPIEEVEFDLSEVA